MSLEIAKNRGLAKTRISKNLRRSKFEPHALTIQPRMLKIPKKLATNDACTYANKLPLRCSKSSTRCKKKHQMQKEIMHFKKLRDTMS